MVSIAEYWRRFRRFLTETRSEMAKVTFPSRNEVIATTAVVLISSVIFALFLALSDLVILRVYEGFHGLISR